MSTSEILAELPKLSFEELEQVHLRIMELEEEMEIKESPEMLAAIEEGRRSIRNERTYTPAEARELLTQWTTKSS